MAITHGTAIRDSFASTVATSLDGGSCVLLDSANTVLCTIALAATNNFSAPSNGTITLDTTNNTYQGSVSTTGTVASFEMRDSTGVKVYGGTVSTAGAGGDLTITNTSVTSGETVSITSHSYTASP